MTLKLPDGLNCDFGPSDEEEMGESAVGNEILEMVSFSYPHQKNMETILSIL